MENTKTVTLDSVSNINDMVAEGLYGSIQDFIDEKLLECDDHGINVLDVKVDENQDLITAEISYVNIQNVKDWMAATSPELSDEDIEDILAA
jgi:hypothetical protein